MVWCVLAQVFAILVDLLAMGRRSADEKDLEIVLLRHELRLLQRRQPAPPRLARWEKRPLAGLAAKLVGAVAGGKARLRRSLLVVSPETVLRWHRDLVRRKWTCTRRRSGDRPALGADLKGLILRFAEENPRWGYSRIHGELRKLGYTLSRSAVRDVLKRHRVPPRMVSLFDVALPTTSLPSVHRMYGRLTPRPSPDPPWCAHKDTIRIAKACEDGRARPRASCGSGRAHHGRL